MPYINTVVRQLLDDGGEPKSPGQLSYKLTRIVLDYLDNKQDIGYNELSEIVGVLECTKQEFIRRVINPYEDEKEYRNGDVFPERT